jgi:hypothetical protein
VEYRTRDWAGSQAGPRSAAPGLSSFLLCFSSRCGPADPVPFFALTCPGPSPCVDRATERGTVPQSSAGRVSRPQARSGPSAPGRGRASSPRQGGTSPVEYRTRERVGSQAGPCQSARGSRPRPTPRRFRSSESGTFTHPRSSTTQATTASER